MQAYLEEIKYGRFDGLTAVLKIPSDEAQLRDGVQYVRLNPRNASLIVALREDNANAQNPVAKNFSLSCCDGLKELMVMRTKLRLQSSPQMTHAACSTVRLLCLRRRRPSHEFHTRSGRKKGKQAVP